VIAIAQVQVVRVGDGRVIASWAYGQFDVLACIGHAGNRVEQRGINPTENRRVCADAEGQSESRNDGKARRFQKCAQAVTKFPNQRPHVLLPEHKSREAPSTEESMLTSK